MRRREFKFELDVREENPGKQMDATRELLGICFDACATCYGPALVLGALAAVIAERAQGQDAPCDAIQEFHKVLDATHDLFTHSRSADKYGPQ